MSSRRKLIPNIQALGSLILQFCVATRNNHVTAKYCLATMAKKNRRGENLSQKCMVSPTHHVATEKSTSRQNVTNSMTEILSSYNHFLSCREFLRRDATGRKFIHSNYSTTGIFFIVETLPITTRIFVVVTNLC